MQTWTTANIPVHRQIDYWTESLDQAFVPLTPTHFKKLEFQGSIKQRSVGELRVSNVASTAHTVTRRPSDSVSRRSNYDVFFNIQHKGRGVTRQRNSEVITLPGDIAVIDTRIPFEVEHKEAFKLTTLSLPRAKLAVDSDIGRSPFISSSVLAETKLKQVLSAYIATISSVEGSITPLSAVRITEAISAALSLLLDWDRQTYVHRAGPAKAKQLDAVIAFIATHLADPSLRVSVIAEHFGVTDRYLHKLFESTGETVMGYINNRRIQKCASELLATPASCRRISTIAFRWGFNDLSSFGRRFRRIHQMSPTEYIKANSP